jgi:hypothetical protein
MGIELTSEAWEDLAGTNIIEKRTAASKQVGTSWDPRGACYSVKAKVGLSPCWTTAAPSSNSHEKDAQC